MCLVSNPSRPYLFPWDNIDHEFQHILINTRSNQTPIGLHYMHQLLKYKHTSKALQRNIQPLDSSNYHTRSHHVDGTTQLRNGMSRLRT